MNVQITKPLFFPRNREYTWSEDITWIPPDTDELLRMYEIIRAAADRIHVLRQCVLSARKKEDGRIRRLMADRKRAIKKAYEKGRTERRRRSWK